MKIQKLSLIVLLCATALIQSGCIKLWQKNLDIKTYMVEVKRDAEPQKEVLAKKLWIDSVHVLPPYNIRNLILRKSDVEFSQSYYTELLMSPSENFENGFYSWFSESGIFETVSMVERTDMSHRLVASVMEFYGDSVEMKAVLRIKVSLFDEKTEGMRVLFSNDYIQRCNLEQADAEQLIRAYNKAFAQILADCEKEIVTALK